MNYRKQAKTLIKRSKTESVILFEVWIEKGWLCIDRHELVRPYWYKENPTTLFYAGPSYMELVHENGIVTEDKEEARQFALKAKLKGCPQYVGTLPVPDYLAIKP